MTELKFLGALWNSVKLRGLKKTTTKSKQKQNVFVIHLSSLDNGWQASSDKSLKWYSVPVVETLNWKTDLFAFHATKKVTKKTKPNENKNRQKRDRKPLFQNFAVKCI